MNDEIMALTNELIYDRQLLCGTIAVAQRRLKIDRDRLLAFCSDRGDCDDEIHDGAVLGDSSWLAQTLLPSNAVVFLDTDEIASEGQEKSQLESDLSGSHARGGKRNKVESDLVFQLVRVACHCGVLGKDIGVISPYRAQARAIRSRLSQLSRDVEISTVDKYQGRDKECIFISLVRSNASGVVGMLLRDWRRVNVAFTRAKTKLVVIGSSSTLRNDRLFKKFLQIVDVRKWNVSLGENAHLIFAGKVAALERHDGEDATKKEDHGVPRRFHPSPRKACSGPVLRSVVDSVVS